MQRLDVREAFVHLKAAPALRLDRQLVESVRAAADGEAGAGRRLDAPRAAASAADHALARARRVAAREGQRERAARGLDLGDGVLVGPARGACRKLSRITIKNTKYY